LNVNQNPAVDSTVKDWPHQQGEVANLIRELDWSSTPLGLTDKWSETLRAVVDMTLASPVAAVTLWGPEHIQIYNDGWAKLHQSRHSEALGQSTNDCFPELAETLAPVYQRVLRNEGVVLEDCLLPISRGGNVEESWWDVIYTPIPGISGTVEGIFCTIAETTGRVVAERVRRKAEAELHAAKERQALLLRFSDTLRPLIDPREIATTATRMVADYFQVERCFISRILREEGKAWIESESRKPHLPSVEGEVNLADFPEVMRIAETQTMVFRDVPADPGLTARDKAALAGLGFGAFIAAVLRKGERNYFWDLVIATAEPREWSFADAPLLEELAERTWVAIERARTAKALLDTEKLAVVGRLASSIAHEINNPLEAVTNLLYLTSRTELPPDAIQYLQLAQLELSRVSQITVETLRFSRQNSNAVPTVLTDLIDSVISLHEGKIRRTGVRVVRRYGTPRELLCFPSQLRQVIANLIGNATDSMMGLPHPRLFVGVRDAHHPRTGEPGVRVTVADTGSGMSQATLAHIWEPFFTTKTSTGTGLGLWVSQEIIRKHAGTVTVRTSTDGIRHGSIFSVFFPYPAAGWNAVVSQRG
jgi:signal transduction histidine kinase